MQKIGPNGDEKSAVATLDGRSRKKQKNMPNESHASRMRACMASTSWRCSNKMTIEVVITRASLSELRLFGSISEGFKGEDLSRKRRMTLKRLRTGVGRT